jgi:hypothetical protein
VKNGSPLCPEQALTRRGQCARQPRDCVYVDITGEVKPPSNIAERIDIAGNRPLIDFVFRLAGTIKIHTDIDTTT